MSNSKLVTYTRLSPNYTKMYGKKNTHIVIHHMAGKLSVEQCGAVFSNPSRYASSNYGVSGKGIGLYVDESNRAWTTSNREIDSKAVTIEVANSTLSPKWEVSDTTMETLIKLCVDICKRNGIKKLNYTGDKKGNLHMHKWYAPTGCPGVYLEKKFKYIADEVNKQLNTSTKKYYKSKKGKTYKVTANKLNLHTKASKNSPTIVQLKKGAKVVHTGYEYPHYAKVKVGDKTGWLYKTYIKQT